MIRNKFFLCWWFQQLGWFWLFWRTNVTGQVSNVVTTKTTTGTSDSFYVYRTPRRQLLQPNYNHTHVSKIPLDMDDDDDDDENVIHIIRINCGASSRIPVITSPNISWSKDRFFQSGTISNRCIPQINATTMTTTNPSKMEHSSIYCTSRYFRNTSDVTTTPLRYDIPVPYNYASYQLRLHFNEQYHNQIGDRIFDVWVEEDILVLNDFDVLRTAPGKNVPLVVSIPTPIIINDSTMTIDFVRNMGNPLINGIEVIFVKMNAPTTTTPSNVTSPMLPLPATLSPNLVPHSSVPTQPRTKLPTNVPDTLPPIATPFPTTSTPRRPTSMPSRAPIKVPMFWNGTFPRTRAPIANATSSSTTKPTKVPTNIAVRPMSTTKLPTHSPRISAPVSNVTLLNSTYPPSFRTNAPTKAPFVAVLPTTRGPTNSSNGTLEMPIPSNTTNNTTPIQRPVQPPIVIGNIVHRINCGSTQPVIVPPNNVVWSADHFVTNGQLYNTCGDENFNNTSTTTSNTTGSIYCTSRFFRTVDIVPYRYDIPIPVPNRTYHIALHFAEQYYTRPNVRIFDVYVEDVLVISNLDLISLRSVNVPYIVTVKSFITDGNITIDFVRVKENPQINGIEVYDDGQPIPLPSAIPQAVIEPTLAPISLPLNSTTTPVTMPTTDGTSNTTTFQDIVINCGGPSYLEQSGLRSWKADHFFTGGSTYSISNIPVMNTLDDPIYQSERVGTFIYSIPVPIGTYEINVHLAELAFTSAGKRKFNLTIESQMFDLVDIFTLAGGSAKAVTLGTSVLVDDGFASIAVAKVLNEPKINGIEIKLSVPHITHSVTNGPYFFVDTSNVGFTTVTVDGSESHTHGTDLFLTKWIWKKGSEIIGTGPVSSFTLPVGVHDITLTVIDSGNFQATEATTVTVYPSGYPSIVALSPSSGSVYGGELLTIKGTGFTFSAEDTVVNFGVKQLTGSDIQVVDSKTITVTSPRIPISVPVLVSVETPLGRSKDATYTYVSSTSIRFATTKLLDFTQPTSVEFGPDGKLYVGSIKGTLAKITLNENYTSFVSMVSAVVQPDRAILGIAFDPLDAGKPIPYVYISSSLLFHGESNSSSGKAINGKISRISGANLDSIEDIVTGLPVCDHDHAVNQIQFGNKGELYVNVGSNTNGGVPGSISGSGRMKENYFSASTLLVDLAHPTFDGFIEYDAPDDGSPIHFSGVSVFASGIRSPFGLTLHSNGNLYATDNGPNSGYGKMKIGCSPSDLLDSQQREDKLLHLIKDKYYGHPNAKRAAYHNDTRQCYWHNPTEPTTNDYQAPIGVLLSSSVGLIEYQADHFDGLLRGNLIHVKFKGGLLRTVLSADGSTANPVTIPGVYLLGRDGLDVAQAPNGNLVEARYVSNTIWISQPIETTTTVIRVGSIFPTRGGVAGGTILHIYGSNFGTSTAVVTVGGSDCPIIGSITSSYIQCTLPGRPEGLYDIAVLSSTGTYTFQNGYRYITGY